MRTISFGNPGTAIHRAKYPYALISLGEKCNTIRVCLCTDTYNAPVRALKSQKYAEFREALIDVTITAIYPNAGLFLCDTRTTTPGSPRGEKLGTGRNCWMRPSKWVPSPVVGATMAKYKSKSQPPSFLLSFRPRISAPLSSFFVYSREPPTGDDALSVVGVHGLYPRPRISLPLFRTPGLSFALPTSLYRSHTVPLSSALIRLTQGLLYSSDHFGFYPRTSSSNKIMDKLNRK